MGEQLSVWISACSSLGSVPRSGISGSQCNSMCNLLKNHHSVLHKGWTIFHSLQKYIRISFKDTWVLLFPPAGEVWRIRTLPTPQKDCGSFKWGPGLPRWLSGKESACHCRRRGFDPWVRKIPWKRTRQPTPVFLLGKFHRQRSLVGNSPWGHKESDMTEQLNSKWGYTQTYMATVGDSWGHPSVSECPVHSAMGCIISAGLCHGAGQLGGHGFGSAFPGAGWQLTKEFDILSLSFLLCSNKWEA